MPKQQANNKSSKGPSNTAWLLKFVGSFAYLYVLMQIWTNPPAWLSGGLSASIPALVLGLIAATAVLTTVGLFLTILASMAVIHKENEMMSMLTWKMGMWSAFTLFVLTLPGPWSWLVLIGFVLYSAGSGMLRM